MSSKRDLLLVHRNWRHAGIFNLLSFLHSTVTNQGTDSNVDICFCENQNDIESSHEISEGY